MAMQLKKASRKSVKIKLGFSGASGFGKTVSALRVAYGITGNWDDIAVIDTENDSASLYANHTLKDGFVIGEFNAISLTPPYTPERYIEAIEACEKSGIKACIIDSITHEWDGKGGCLDIHAEIGGRFDHWAKVTPRHRAFIDKILQCNMHVLTTVRRKQDYEMVKNDKGKIEPVKVGTKEVTKDGFEYELTVNFELVNEKHLAKASKDRTGMFADAPEVVLTEKTGEKIREWCESGVDLSDKIVDAIAAFESATTVEQLTEIKKEYSIVIDDKGVNKAGSEAYKRITYKNNGIQRV